MNQVAFPASELLQLSRPPCDVTEWWFMGLLANGLLHFGCGRATPPVSRSRNWPSGRMQIFLIKIGQKKLFFAKKDPQTNFDAWLILQKPVLSFKCNDNLKMANLKAISSSATLTHRDRDKIAAISQTTLSSAFSWMKMFRFKFHRRLFRGVQLTIFQHWLR